jgi:hypothetical protein
MKKKHKFEIGDRVIVKSFGKRPSHWNSQGLMDQYMGQTVTIKEFLGGHSYIIEEDSELYGGFYWSEKDFESPMEILPEELFEL